MKKLQELFIKHKYILVLKIMSAAYFSNEFETTFIMEANTMNPDQTAP